jgi:hypothetical protein
MSSFVVAEGLTIHVNHLKVDLCIPNKFIHTIDDGEKFLDLKPERWRDIAILITSFCKADDRKSKEITTMFRSKNGTGIKFLKWMRRHRNNAVRSKFKIKGVKRITARMRTCRAEQMTSDMISVPMPQVGDSALATVIDHRMVKLQRCISVKIDDNVLTYIGKAFQYFVENPLELGVVDNDCSSDNDESNEDTPDVDDDIVKSDHEGEVDADPDDAAVHRPVLQLSQPHTSSDVVRSSRIFQAFQQAA